MMHSQIVADRVRATMPGNISIPGNTTEMMDGDTSQVDLNVSVFSNAIPQNMLLDNQAQ